jgi:hypothetical protein
VARSPRSDAVDHNVVILLVLLALVVTLFWSWSAPR